MPQLWCLRRFGPHRVAVLLDAPYAELDVLYHGSGWVPRPEFLDDVRRLCVRDRWTTERQYRGARESAIPLKALAARRSADFA
jgi:hypothetical protein